MNAVILLFIALVAVVIIYGVIQSAKRRKDMEALAPQVEMEFAPYDPFDLPAKHADMLAFSKGHSRRAYNTLYTKKDGHRIVVTDYKYTEGSGKNSHTYYETYCIMDTDRQFARLQIRPENFLDTVASWVGFDDIDFESSEFNDAFYVRCDDKKFAYEIIHPQMMQYLLGYRGLHLEMAGKSVLAHYGRTLPIDRIPALVQAVQDIVRLLPAYS